MSEILAKATTGVEKYKTAIEARTHTYIADEPFDENGQDLGMKPTELLAGALASCTSITLRMYADRKGWDTGEIYVTVNLVRDTAASLSTFKRIVSFEKELETAQKERLLSIANACPVHKILSGSIQIDTRIEA